MRWRNLFLFAGIAAACTEPSPDPLYLVTFQNVETFTYGGAGCGGSPTPYCGTWSSDAYSFVGTLHGNPANALSVNGVEFTRETADGAFTSPALGGCNSFTVTGQQDNEFSGTFVEITDCHNAGHRGTFTAERSDIPD